MNISVLSTDPKNCEKCGFEAESIYDLDAHTWDVNDNSIEDDFCENTFENERDLMRHKKEEHCKDPPLQQENKDDQSYFLSCQFEEHEERINICRKYASGKYKFGSENCWFQMQIEVNLNLNVILVKKTLVNQDKF